jgi:hypothetical protein
VSLRLRRLLSGVAAALALIPAAALAHSSTGASGSPSHPILNVTSDASALKDYNAYVASLVAGIGASRAADDALVTSVATSCAKELAPLRSKPASQISTTILSEFGQEIGGELSVQFNARALPAFERMAAKLRKLRWSSAGLGSVVGTMVSAVQGWLTVTPAEICADGNTLLGAPLVEPAGTTAFLARYEATSTASTQQLDQFLKLLGQFETPADSGLITSINRLAPRYQAALKNAGLADGRKIVRALGLPGA